MMNPPAGVKLVMSAVCVMKDIKPEKINDPAGTGQKVRRPCWGIYIFFMLEIYIFFMLEIDLFFMLEIYIFFMLEIYF